MNRGAFTKLQNLWKEEFFCFFRLGAERAVFWGGRSEDFESLTFERILCPFSASRMPPTSLRSRPTCLILSCEHAGHHVPEEVTHCFQDAAEVLQSHRGWDPGALRMAEWMANELSVPLTCTEISRLVIEPNRSLGHPKLFSEFTRDLPASARQQLIDRYYLPHRAAVTERIAAGVTQGPVVHVGVHSFTAELAGEVRNADVGLLYDPRRPAEKLFCQRWRTALSATWPQLRVRFNYPYRGAADGLTTTLRREYGDAVYAGIELEVNQSWFQGTAGDFDELTHALCRSLSAALGHE